MLGTGHVIPAHGGGDDDDTDIATMIWNRQRLQARVDASAIHQCLLAEGIAFVVAWSTDMDDDAGPIFTQAFYDDYFEAETFIASSFII